MACGILGVVAIMGAGMTYVKRRCEHDLNVRFRYECPLRMFAVWSSLSDAETRRTGFFPTNLVPFAKSYPPSMLSNPANNYPLLCPGSTTQPGSVTNVDQWTDYLYVPWARYFPSKRAVPENYPLMYDRRFSNHGGRGVYVLKMNGDVIWDGGAAWLKRFSTEHPEFLLPMPE
jgi:hypothetical protein